MKIIRLSFAILSLACITHGETNEAYQITSYSPSKGMVGIKIGPISTNQMFNSFSEDEKKRITAWLADREFANGGLVVEIKRKQKSRKTNDSDRTGEVKDISYEITLKNVSEVDLRNVQIESHIFYETHDGNKKANRLTIKSEYTDVLSGETQNVQTKTVSIRDEWTKHGLPDSTGLKSLPVIHYRDQLLGMVLCVSRKNQRGKTNELKFEDGAPPEKADRIKYR